MKKVMFCLLILGIGFAFMGCNNGTTDGKGSAPSNRGTLTIINIPSEFNGKYISFNAGNEVIAHDGRFQSVVHFSQIRNDKAALPTWRWMDGELIYFNGTTTVTAGWVGTGMAQQNIFVFLAIYSEPDTSNHPDGVPTITRRFFGSVSFVNGSGTLDWNDSSSSYN